MSDLFKLEFLLPDCAAVGPMELALEGSALAISSFEAGGDAWRVEALYAGMPDYDRVAEAVANGARIAGVPLPEFSLTPLPAVDWVSENQKSFDPVIAGRFFVHPSHLDRAVPPGAVAIRMDAGMAFGTGSHGTTQGCLMLIDHLLRRRAVRRVLDVGCGTGILAIGCALVARSARVDACDIDPDAVAVTQENCRLNGLPRRLRTAIADGVPGRWRRRGGCYDLVIANILAKPLRMLAPDLTGMLAPGGHLVLSGLLNEQEPMVMTAYRRQGLSLVRRDRREGWSSLLLRRGK